MRVLRKLLMFVCGLAFVGAFMVTGAKGQKVGSSLLGAGDFKDYPGLVERLRKREDAVSQYIFGRLPEATQQWLTQGSDIIKYQEYFIAELNLLLQGPLLYEATRFAGVKLSTETQVLLDDKPTGQEESVRLNRYLFDDAYPNQIISYKFIKPKNPSSPPLTPAPTPKPTPRTVIVSPQTTPAPPEQPPAPPVALDPRPFYAALQRFKVALPEDCSDEVGQRIVQEYGAVFVAQNVTPPSRCVFANEAEVQAFQRQAKTTPWQGFTLQTQALSYLGGAMREGAKMGLRISPRGGEAAGRSFGATVKYWNSRFYPALAHWTRRGAITPSEAARIRSLPIREQVAAVLQLEAKGYYFSKDLTKSILYSVAAPGSSQHIALLALDINEFKDSRVRALLAKYGWFQTVKSDLPHFTFIGVPETDLPLLGLRAEVVGGQKFWLPDMTPTAKPEDKTDKPQ